MVDDELASPNCSRCFEYLCSAAIFLAGDLVGLFVFEGFVGDGSDLFMFL